MLQRLRGRWFGCLLLADLFLCSPVHAQSMDDPCLTITFTDGSMNAQYGLLKANLFGTSAELRTAELALSEVRLQISQNVDKPEFLARFAADTARMNGAQSELVRETVAAIGASCLARLKDFPEAHVQAVSRAARRQQAMLALPPAARAEALQREAAKLQADWKTPDDVLRTLKSDLARLQTEVAALRKR